MMPLLSLITYICDVYLLRFKRRTIHCTLQQLTWNSRSQLVH